MDRPLNFCPRRATYIFMEHLDIERFRVKIKLFGNLIFNFSVFVLGNDHHDMYHLLHFRSIFLFLKKS